MPNGFHGQKDEWNRMEGPLVRIDDAIEAFANREALQLSRNYHNWPERSLTWNSSNVRKLIQVFLQDKKKLTLTVWICASADRGRNRFWKQKKLRDPVTAEEITPELNDVLAEGKKILDSWNAADLELATGDGSLAVD